MAILNAKPMSLETMLNYQKNPHVSVSYKAKAVADGFALIAIIGGEENSLERQRGGVRVFKTLNALLSFLGSRFQVKRFVVEGDGWNPKQKEFAA